MTPRRPNYWMRHEYPTTGMHSEPLMPHYFLESHACLESNECHTNAGRMKNATQPLWEGWMPHKCLENEECHTIAMEIDECHITNRKRVNATQPPREGWMPHNHQQRDECHSTTQRVGWMPHNHPERNGCHTAARRGKDATLELKKVVLFIEITLNC